MPGHCSQSEPVRPYKIPESVLVVIHTIELELLLIKRADAGDFWQSVTGSKDTAAESLVETAVREVAEETGIDCGPGTPLEGGLRAWGVTNEYDIYPQWRHRYDPVVNRNTEHLFGLFVTQGLEDPSRNVAYLLQGGLGLPYDTDAELAAALDFVSGKEQRRP